MSERDWRSACACCGQTTRLRLTAVERGAKLLLEMLCVECRVFLLDETYRATIKESA